VFWSKIVYFVLGIAAAVGIGMALTMPRPAQRKVLEAEEERLVRARSSVEMLLRENAREWVDLASDFARYPAPAGQPRLKIDSVLEVASRGENGIPDGAQADGRDTLQYILGQVSGAQKPEVAVALDKWGRVVASVGVADRKVGDDLSGYFLVRDALRGYLRDDLWYEGGKLYRMSAAPVINRQLDYVGAIVLGDEVDLPLCKALEDRVGAHVSFFVRGDMVQTSIDIPSDEIKKNYLKLKGQLESKEGLRAFDVQKGDVSYRVALKPLPGEAGGQDGFIAVFTQRPTTAGFFGTLEQVTKDDLAFGKFPWIPLGVAFVIMVLGGLGLMWLESDRPIRRLAEDSVRLGKGDIEKLAEDSHRGKFGSIARSVNIALEKVTREAKASRKDLGAVLGPPPEDSMFGGPGSAPGMRKSGSHQSPFAPPPPAAFSFEPPAASSPLGAALGAMPSAGPVDFPPPPPPARAQRPQPTPPSVPPLAQAASARPAGRPPGLPPIPSAAKPPAPPPAPSATNVRVSNALPLSQVPSLDDDLLAPNMDSEMMGAPKRTAAPITDENEAGPTMVGGPSEDLIRQSAQGSGDDAYYRQVFQEFVELKRKCGESTDGLTFDKFSLKLKQNRDQLVARYACKAVKFQVYVKDGKAALKATPVKT
jgi:hypothetical protein